MLGSSNKVINKYIHKMLISHVIQYDSATMPFLLSHQNIKSFSLHLIADSSAPSAGHLWHGNTQPAQRETLAVMCSWIWQAAVFIYSFQTVCCSKAASNPLPLTVKLKKKEGLKQSYHKITALARALISLLTSYKFPLLSSLFFTV